MNKLYYTIGEVARLLGESTSLVRFWTNYYSKYLKPQRNAKGNRLYKEDELEFLKTVHFLVKEQGMTLEGAEKKIAESRKSVESKVKAIEALKAIRTQLKDVRNSL